MAGSLNTVFLREDRIPQSEQVDARQEKNSAGGFTFTVSPLDQIKRFLILGSESSFYQSGAKFSQENATNIISYVDGATAEEQRAVIDLVVEISQAGRAPKQQPGLFTLALVIARSTSAEVKNYGYRQLPKVARTGTTLFEFAEFLNQFQRFGMGARKAIARWYDEKPVEKIAYQVAKYRARAGFTHADLLRLSKRVKSEKNQVEPSRNAVMNWIVGKEFDQENLPKILQGLEIAKNADTKELPEVITHYGLTWEMLPTEALKDDFVWDALLTAGNVPLGALLRNLGRLTNLGLFRVARTKNLVLERFNDVDEIKRSRLHPMNILIALKTYASGRGIRGENSWEPVPEIVAALDRAFYLAFGNVEPTGSRMMIALDVSGSMAWSSVAGLPITPAEAVGALSLVTLNVEEDVNIVGFSSNVVPINLTKGMTLKRALSTISRITMGSTDASAAIEHARKNKIPVDTFVVMTDNETWSGRIHPHISLQKYRKEMGINAKLIVVATEATRFSIADPKDPGMLDIAGFDTATPQIISEFSRGI